MDTTKGYPIVEPNPDCVRLAMQVAGRVLGVPREGEGDGPIVVVGSDTIVEVSWHSHYDSCTKIHST